MKIEVFASPVSTEVVETFASAAGFYKWQAESEPGLVADRVAVNGVLMMGWDEIEEELG